MFQQTEDEVSICFTNKSRQRPLVVYHTAMGSGTLILSSTFYVVFGGGLGTLDVVCRQCFGGRISSSIYPSLPQFQYIMSTSTGQHLRTEVYLL